MRDRGTDWITGSTVILYLAIIHFYRIIFVFFRIVQIKSCIPPQYRSSAITSDSRIPRFTKVSTLASLTSFTSFPYFFHLCSILSPFLYPFEYFVGYG